jgi:hypothetical protein
MTGSCVHGTKMHLMPVSSWVIVALFSKLSWGIRSSFAGVKSEISSHALTAH